MTSCDHCPSFIEDANHVLLNFPFTVSYWSHIVNYCPGRIIPPILGLVDLLFATHVEGMSKSILAIASWILWDARNKRVSSDSSIFYSVNV